LHAFNRINNCLSSGSINSGLLTKNDTKFS
jgi:hypothetical protein